MQSYINYYGVEKGTDKYTLISKDVLAMLKVITGTDDLDKADLAAAAEDYLLSGGMTAEQIKALKANFSTELAGKTDEASNINNNDKETTTVTTYTVVKGDCLWMIAKKQLGDGTRYIEIYKLNENTIQNPDMIMIGQKLVLPEK
jgi:nucleoid-associated protein YgaU